MARKLEGLVNAKKSQRGARVNGALRGVTHTFGLGMPRVCASPVCSSAIALREKSEEELRMEYRALAPKREKAEPMEANLRMADMVASGGGGSLFGGDGGFEAWMMVVTVDSGMMLNE